MAIEVGQILDKYELTEKVGQGGMAVVYRARDNSLQRTVAVKVLHRHLAEHQEARDRFEREARTVARLHHENILEIYDFSGKDSEDSYIVTEFIEGETLKEFISDHHIGYPEIGAMIAVELCSALKHAHGLGVLHRDIKPENIMIRDDGAVKLMDFGIAQMLDMQRMTVTGQLLGSPAYMAPEHLEGENLDFRTDVFAVGIVLYQLVIGKLPFRGKNPHEILKRIAECVYDDPRTSNQQVGRELGRIIDTALSRNPDDRYADIGAMQDALLAYLQRSGLTEPARELTRFFQAPGSYERALRERLLHELCARGQALSEAEPVRALEFFNRVLTIEPGHTEVLSAIDRMSRKRRWQYAALLFGAILLLSLGVLTLAKSQLFGTSRPSPDATPVDAPAPADAALALDANIDASPAPTDATPTDATPTDATPTDAGIDAPIRIVKRSPPRQNPSKPIDAGVTAAPISRAFVLSVTQRQSEYRVDRGVWKSVSPMATFDVGPGAHTVEVRNTTCCVAKTRTIAATDPGGRLRITLDYIPATITPHCRTPGVRVQIDDGPARLERKHLVFITGGLGRKQVSVRFIGEHTDTHTLNVHYNQHKDITCRFD